jgi:MAternally affected uncoordination
MCVADLYRMCNEHARENDAYQMHCNFSQMLLKDHFQSSQMSEHSLINWTDGSFPVVVGNPPSTSGAIL